MQRGIFELDEIYARLAPCKAAKADEAHSHDAPFHSGSRGCGTKRLLVLVAAERGGRVETYSFPTHGKAALVSVLKERLDLGALLITNELLPVARLARATTSKITTPATIR